MADTGGDGEELGNPAGFIARYIGEGTNATQSLSAYREAGGAISTQTWYRLYGQVADTLLRRPEVGELDPNAYPAPNQYGEWAMGQGGQYATQVAVTIRDRDTGLLSSVQYTYITDDPHTLDEATAAAMDEYGDPDMQNQYGQQVVGAMAVDVWQTVPYGG